MNPPRVYSDAAKRASYEVNLHLELGGEGKWVAIPIADDGTCDHVAYDSRADALFHQSNPQLYAYIRIPFDGMNLDDAERFIAIQRKIYDSGFRLIDPEMPEPVMPHTIEGFKEALRNPLKIRFSRRVR